MLFLITFIYIIISVPGKSTNSIKFFSEVLSLKFAHGLVASVPPPADEFDDSS